VQCILYFNIVSLGPTAPATFDAVFRRTRNTVMEYKYMAAEDNKKIDLERCNKVKFRGVIMDSRISFSDRRTEKVNKA